MSAPKEKADVESSDASFLPPGFSKRFVPKKMYLGSSEAKSSTGAKMEASLARLKKADTRKASAISETKKSQTKSHARTTSASPSTSNRPSPDQK